MCIRDRNNSIRPILPILRKEKFDFIIDLHHNLRTFLVKKNLLFVKSYSFKKGNIEKWLMTNFKINRLPKNHIVDRYLATIKPLGVKNDNQGLDFFINPQDIPGFKHLTYLRKNIPAFMVLPIGAGKNTKALTIGKIIAICKKVNFPIVLLGGKQEIVKSLQIEKQFNPSIPLPQIINFVGKCSLLESAAIVKNAKLVLTGDTGLMHIAAAFKKPIISIWGNTIPEFGMSPYYPKGLDLNEIVEVENLSCRPCSKIGFDTCPLGHFNCINAIETQEINAKIQNLLLSEKKIDH